MRVALFLWNNLKASHMFEVMTYIGIGLGLGLSVSLLGLGGLLDKA